MKRYEKYSKRQGARANHPKQTAPLERRAPSAHFFRASRLLGVSLQLGHAEWKVQYFFNTEYAHHVMEDFVVDTCL